MLTLRCLFTALLSMVAFIAAAMPAEASGEVIPPSPPPQKTVTPFDGGVRVTYVFPAPELRVSARTGLTEVLITGLSNGFAPGSPALPGTKDSFEIPLGFSPEVKVVSSHYTQYAGKVGITKWPLLDTKSASSPIVSEAAVTGGWFPESQVELELPGKYRGHTIAYVRVQPVQYDSDSETIRIYDSITYEINYVAQKAKRSERSSGRIFYDTDEETVNHLHKILTHAVAETNVPAAVVTPSSNEPCPQYLILSNPSLKNAVDRFARWKQLMGYNVSTVYRADWDTISIRQYIWDKMPKIVLFFGDDNLLPAKHCCFYNEQDGFVDRYYSSSDYFYACIGDESPEEFTDKIPDMIYGRLPAANLEDAEIMVNKIIKAEGTPPTNASFYNNALVAGFFQHGEDLGFIEMTEYGIESRRFTLTLEETRNYLMKQGIEVERVYNTNHFNPWYWSGEYLGAKDELICIPDELHMDNLGWHGNGIDITNAINNGTGLIIYRGHGSVQSWSSITFSKIDFKKLVNTNYPLLLGLTCETGNFNKWKKTGDCMAEQLLKKPDGGVAGFFGASMPSSSFDNCACLKWMINMLYPTPGYTTDIWSAAQERNMVPENTAPTFRKNLGWLLFTAIDYLANDNPEAIQLFRENYHCFGDPLCPSIPRFPKGVHTPHLRTTMERL